MVWRGKGSQSQQVMTDHTERNRSVAKALGFNRAKYGCLEYWEIPVKATSKVLILSNDEWKPWTDLNQAVDFLIPILDEMDCIMHMYMNGQEMQFRLGSNHVMHQREGEGTIKSERCASAICKTFLYMAEQYPDLLKEALKRMAA